MDEDAVRRELIGSGELRAVVNLGNPVLAQGTARHPRGVTVDLAHEIARRLDVPLALHCVDAARNAVDALLTGAADIGFLAIEPARERDLSFTSPYAVIEAVFAVPVDSTISTVADVDRPGFRVGVKRGSAYDLFLTRTLTSAEVVRGDEGLDVFRAQRLEVGAGIRQPVAEQVARSPDLRLVDEPFMAIRQAVAVRQGAPAAAELLRSLVEELVLSGVVAASLRRSGQAEAVVVPHVPVTARTCQHVRGPFFHGTRGALAVGDELVAGRGSNYQSGRRSNNIYFSALLDTAVWGAELATALSGDTERGRVYVVEPTGPFEDDPNVTDKKFPGNRTQSYRSRSPLRVVGEVEDWPPHPPEVLARMLDGLARLRAEGRDVILD